MGFLQSTGIFYAHFLVFVASKEALNISCTLDPMQITVDIFTHVPLYNVQLKNADKSCDPQEFTSNSIRFNIQNYQLGMCGFVRSDSTTTGLDGTFWNNLIWKDKPTSKLTKTTKVKCQQKLSTLFQGAMPLPMPVRVQVIHLPFGAFPSAFGSGDGGAADGVPSSASSRLPLGMLNPFPPGISPGAGGMILLRSGIPGLQGFPGAANGAAMIPDAAKVPIIQ